MSGESWRHMGVIARDKKRQPAPDQASTGNKKRNTKRWCKGKPGVEHKYEHFTKVHDMGWSVDGTRHFVFKMKYLKCVKCGREEWRWK